MFIDHKLARFYKEIIRYFTAGVFFSLGRLNMMSNVGGGDDVYVGGEVEGHVDVATTRSRMKTQTYTLFLLILLCRSFHKLLFHFLYNLHTIPSDFVV